MSALEHLEPKSDFSVFLKNFAGFRGQHLTQKESVIIV